MSGDHRWLGLGVIGLLMIGAALGRNSVDPVIVHDTETQVQTKTITKTKRVEVPTVPQACLDAVNLATLYASEANKMVDHVPTMTDAISLARRGIAAKSPASLTEAENTLNRADNQMLDSFMNIQDNASAYGTAIKDCEDALP